MGSGVIFDADKGLIITNEHVVDDEKVMIVTLKDGERYHAKLVAKDKDYDIAIIQIQAKHLTALPFGDSDSVAVGDFVTAIGSPYGLSQTVTSGVVSALNRSHPQIEGYQNFIQTDAPINPGNSGGALVNMKGQLIGINTAIIAPTDGNIGIGFAIPSNMAQAVIDQLLKYGKVERGILGVIAQNITPELANALHLSTTHGALISQIVPNTPAASAHLKPQEVITAVNNHPIHNAEQLRNIMGLTRPGTTVEMTILENNIPKKITIIVADPDKIKSDSVPYFAGLRLDQLTELEKDGVVTHGLLVSQVDDDSAGALAGLVPNDVITAINGKPVPDITALQTLTKDEKNPIVLTVLHDNNQTIYLVLNPS